VNDREWSLVVDELGWLVGELRRQGQAARERQGLSAAPDGYPRSSLPEASIASGRLGDPTGRAVINLAGGRGDKPDTWKRSYEPVATNVRRMESECRDALARLQGAYRAMLQAIESKGPTTEGTQRE